MSLKRDNWTKQEIINIISGLRVTLDDGKEISLEDSETFAEMNSDLNGIIEEIKINLKETWTNTEIKEFLKPFTNFAYVQARGVFAYYACDPKEFGALAYDTKTGAVYHVGTVPLVEIGESETVCSGGCSKCADGCKHGKE